MLAAVDDVHHRRRQQPGAGAAQVADTAAGRSDRPPRGPRPATRPGSRWRPGSSCSRVPSSSIIRWSIAGLVERVHADQLVGQLLVDVVDRLRSRPCRGRLASCRRRAVPRLRGRRCWRRWAPPARPNEPSASVHVDFDGRIAAAVENLPAVNVNNRAHGDHLPFQ